MQMLRAFQEVLRHLISFLMLGQESVYRTQELT